MCGRYASTRSSADLADLFEAFDLTEDRLVADYNIAPTDPVPIVRVRDRREVVVARWGLVPHWASDPRVGARMINARAETVATSSAFAPSFANRRCLVPADGWYEWHRLASGAKQAYFLTPRDGGVLAFAGLWARAGDLVTCSIVTMAAAGELTEVHDRMPLFLPPERWSQWLDGGGEPAELLAAPPAIFVAGMEIRPVGPAVGDVRNDGPQLVTRVDISHLDGVSPQAADPTLF
jgi:putative SOS response-associated peptidase YedK